MAAQAHLRAPAASLQYHVLKFGDTREAAAFVAAFSRFLNSPAGAAYRRRGHSIEVWSHAAEGEAMELYLNGDALAAAREAFAPLPAAGARQGKTLPGGCLLILSGHPIPAWGIADAYRQLKRMCQ